MKCPHCLVEFHPEVKWIYLDDDSEGLWFLEKYQCPKCNKFILFLINAEAIHGTTNTPKNVKRRIMFRPLGINRAPISGDVPTILSEDYTEACLVLPYSPKASAALSRRCLQYLLREYAKVKPGDLTDEIQQVIDSKALPTHISQAVDAIRNIGNFAAHPMKSKSTGEIVPVEPLEAEWNLDVLESLFDFYFVQPKILQVKREELNKKLADLGKPPMK